MKSLHLNIVATISLILSSLIAGGCGDGAGNPNPLASEKLAASSFVEESQSPEFEVLSLDDKILDLRQRLGLKIHVFVTQNTMPIFQASKLNAENQKSLTEKLLLIDRLRKIFLLKDRWIDAIGFSGRWSADSTDSSVGITTPISAKLEDFKFYLVSGAKKELDLRQTISKDASSIGISLTSNGHSDPDTYLTQLSSFSNEFKKALPEIKKLDQKDFVYPEAIIVEFKSDANQSKTGIVSDLQPAIAYQFKSEQIIAFLQKNSDLIKAFRNYVSGLSAAVQPQVVQIGSVMGQFNIEEFERMLAVLNVAQPKLIEYVRLVPVVAGEPINLDLPNEGDARENAVRKTRSGVIKINSKRSDAKVLKGLDDLIANLKAIGEENITKELSELSERMDKCVQRLNFLVYCFEINTPENLDLMRKVVPFFENNVERLLTLPVKRQAGINLRPVQDSTDNNVYAGLEPDALLKRIADIVKP